MASSQNVGATAAAKILRIVFFCEFFFNASCLLFRAGSLQVVALRACSMNKYHIDSHKLTRTQQKR